MPRPYDQVVSLFINHSPQDEEGAVELLKEIFTHFDELPDQVTNLLINNGLLHQSAEVRCLSIDYLGRKAPRNAIVPFGSMAQSHS